MPPSQFGKQTQAIRQAAEAAVFSTAAYNRCLRCSVAMHKDGHEQALWCVVYNCPNTAFRVPQSQHSKLLGEVK